jgi:hypothetical protein
MDLATIRVFWHAPAASVRVLIRDFGFLRCFVAVFPHVFRSASPALTLVVRTVSKTQIPCSQWMLQFSE